MEIAKIVQALERHTYTLPRKALEAAVAQRDAITPELMRFLEYTVANAEALAAERREDLYFGHIHAMYLLAQFRETRAFPLLVRFCELPGQTPEDLLDDTVTEGLDRILASTFDGDTDALKRVIENPACNDYVRAAALRTLVILVRVGAKERDEVVAYMAALFHEKVERVPCFFWDALISCAVELHAHELEEDIRRAYEEELADPTFMAPSEAAEALAKDKDRALKDLPQNVPGLIDDAIADMQSWACFDEAENNLYPLPAPVRQPPPPRNPPKIGRNDKCPCGSGKKYKKCCGQNAG